MSKATNNYTVKDFERDLSEGPYAWPGGYTKLFIMSDCEPLCFACAKSESKGIVEAINDGGLDKQWTPLGVEVHWEGPDMYCSHCNAAMESEYGDPNDL